MTDKLLRHSDLVASKVLHYDTMGVVATEEFAEAPDIPSRREVVPLWGLFCRLAAAHHPATSQTVKASDYVQRGLVVSHASADTFISQIDSFQVSRQLHRVWRHASPPLKRHMDVISWNTALGREPFYHDLSYVITMEDGRGFALVLRHRYDVVAVSRDLQAGRAPVAVKGRTFLAAETDGGALLSLSTWLMMVI